MKKNPAIKVIVQASAVNAVTVFLASAAWYTYKLSVAKKIV